MSVAKIVSYLQTVIVSNKYSFTYSGSQTQQ